MHAIPLTSAECIVVPVTRDVLCTTPLALEIERRWTVSFAVYAQAVLEPACWRPDYVLVLPTWSLRPDPTRIVFVGLHDGEEVVPEQGSALRRAVRDMRSVAVPRGLVGARLAAELAIAWVPVVVVPYDVPARATTAIP